MLFQRRDDWVDNTYPGPNERFEGYDESAARVQALYEGDGFEALLNVHARHLNGTARLFRANIIEPGTNDLVDGFDEDKVALDGVNHSELDSFGANARLSWELGDDYTLYSITGYETLDTFSRGDIDGGFGAVFRAGSGPASFRSPRKPPTAFRTTRSGPRNSASSRTPDGAWNWQAGLFYFDEDYDVESFSYDSLNGNAAGRLRAHQPDQRLVGRVRRRDLAGHRRRSSCAAALRYTWDKKDLKVEEYFNTGFAPCIGQLLGLPAAAGALHAHRPGRGRAGRRPVGLDGRREVQLGPVGHLRGQRRRERVRAASPPATAAAASRPRARSTSSRSPSRKPPPRSKRA